MYLSKTAAFVLFHFYKIKTLISYKSFTTSVQCIQYINIIQQIIKRTDLN